LSDILGRIVDNPSSLSVQHKSGKKTATKPVLPDMFAANVMPESVLPPGFQSKTSEDANGDLPNCQITDEYQHWTTHFMSVALTSITALSVSSSSMKK
jgi:hypothetical protein